VHYPRWNMHQLPARGMLPGSNEEKIALYLLRLGKGTGCIAGGKESQRVNIDRKVKPREPTKLN
jgi:hypothetical protein